MNVWVCCWFANSGRRHALIIELYKVECRIHFFVTLPSLSNRLVEQDWNDIVKRIRRWKCKKPVKQKSWRADPWNTSALYILRASRICMNCHCDQDMFCISKIYTYKTIIIWRLWLLMLFNMHDNRWKKPRYRSVDVFFDMCLAISREKFLSLTHVAYLFTSHWLFVFQGRPLLTKVEGKDRDNITEEKIFSLTKEYIHGQNRAALKLRYKSSSKKRMVSLCFRSRTEKPC